MFKLILGRAGTGKTTAVLSRLTEAGQRRKQVLIVPEQQSHEAERALCRAGGDRVSLYADCLLYTSDAADDLTRVDLGGRRIIKKRSIY